MRYTHYIQSGHLNLNRENAMYRIQSALIIAALFWVFALIGYAVLVTTFATIILGVGLVMPSRIPGIRLHE